MKINLLTLEFNNECITLAYILTHPPSLLLGVV